RSRAAIHARSSSGPRSRPPSVPSTWRHARRTRRTGPRRARDPGSAGRDIGGLRDQGGRGAARRSGPWASARARPGFGFGPGSVGPESTKPHRRPPGGFLQDPGAVPRADPQGQPGGAASPAPPSVEAVDRPPPSTSGELRMDSVLQLAESLMASPWLLLLVIALAVGDSLVPMVPAETVVLTAGTFAVTGSPSAALLVVAAWAGALLGDVLAHHVGRGAGPLTRRLRRRRYAGAVVGAAETALRSRGGVIILGARFVPGARTAVNITSGAIRFPRPAFVLYSSLAALLWSVYYVGIGMLGGIAFGSDPLLGVAVGITLALLLGSGIELVRSLRAGRAASTGAVSRRVPAATDA